MRVRKFRGGSEGGDGEGLEVAEELGGAGGAGLGA